jgi:hypothetical protein
MGDKKEWDYGPRVFDHPNGVVFFLIREDEVPWLDVLEEVRAIARFIGNPERRSCFVLRMGMRQHGEGSYWVSLNNDRIGFQLQAFLKASGARPTVRHEPPAGMNASKKLRAVLGEPLPRESDSSLEEQPLPRRRPPEAEPSGGERRRGLDLTGQSAQARAELGSINLSGAVGKLKSAKDGLNKFRNRKNKKNEGASDEES